MSAKFSVVCLSITLVAFLLFSCAPAYENECKSAFERPFSAEITLKRPETEYKASVTLSATPTLDTGTDDTALKRDGMVVYTYPDTLSGLSLVRAGDEVRLNVSGIEIVPSRSIADKYTFVLDLIDIRAESISGIRQVSLDGTDAYELSFEHEGERYAACIEKESRIPLFIEGADIKITFDTFVYT